MVGCGNSSKHTFEYLQADFTNSFTHLFIFHYVKVNGNCCLELSEDMHTDGYRNIHNIDISDVVLDKMRQ